MANSIYIIHPYRSGGTWVFDDAQHGLCREPFVSGIPEMIDRMVEEIPDAEQGFNLLFSKDPFPGFHKEFRRTRSEFGGTWYRDEQKGDEGWLCPALFHYFKDAPERIYTRAEPKGKTRPD